ncbi:hypothetical protein CYMTET_7625 [Cymbomonas tetramitiformis]|uniref:Uncharacterized protein n=1 Tax=Cymbomonas tetramitiformis TaxID=36881 RepID=A0AAE0GVB1_9CHLO|nr:hypothetical protein CYMTET_7625 [Cymbomonas tetramitiformis]
MLGESVVDIIPKIVHSDDELFRVGAFMLPGTLPCRLRSALWPLFTAIGSQATDLQNAQYLVNSTVIPHIRSLCRNDMSKVRRLVHSMLFLSWEPVRQLSPATQREREHLIPTSWCLPTPLFIFLIRTLDIGDLLRETLGRVSCARAAAKLQEQLAEAGEGLPASPLQVFSSAVLDIDEQASAAKGSLAVADSWPVPRGEAATDASVAMADLLEDGADGCLGALQRLACCAPAEAPAHPVLLAILQQGCARIAAAGVCSALFQLVGKLLEALARELSGSGRGAEDALGRGLMRELLQLALAGAKTLGGMGAAGKEAAVSLCHTFLLHPGYSALRHVVHGDSVLQHEATQELTTLTNQMVYSEVTAGETNGDGGDAAQTSLAQGVGVLVDQVIAVAMCAPSLLLRKAVAEASTHRTQAAMMAAMLALVPPVLRWRNNDAPRPYIEEVLREGLLAIPTAARALGERGGGPGGGAGGEALIHLVGELLEPRSALRHEDADAGPTVTLLAAPELVQHVLLPLMRTDLLETAAALPVVLHAARVVLGAVGRCDTASASARPARSSGGDADQRAASTTVAASMPVSLLLTLLGLVTLRTGGASGLDWVHPMDRLPTSTVLEPALDLLRDLVAALAPGVGAALEKAPPAAPRMRALLEHLACEAAAASAGPHLLLLLPLFARCPDASDPLLVAAARPRQGEEGVPSCRERRCCEAVVRCVIFARQSTVHFARLPPCSPSKHWGTPTGSLGAHTRCVASLTLWVGTGGAVGGRQQPHAAVLGHHLGERLRAKLCPHPEAASELRGERPASSATTRLAQTAPRALHAAAAELTRGAAEGAASVTRVSLLQGLVQALPGCTTREAARVLQWVVPLLVLGCMEHPSQGEQVPVMKGAAICSALLEVRVEQRCSGMPESATEAEMGLALQLAVLCVDLCARCFLQLLGCEKGHGGKDRGAVAGDLMAMARHVVMVSTTFGGSIRLGACGEADAPSDRNPEEEEACIRPQRAAVTEAVRSCLRRVLGCLRGCGQRSRSGCDERSDAAAPSAQILLRGALELLQLLGVGQLEDLPMESSEPGEEDGDKCTHLTEDMLLSELRGKLCVR